MRSQQEFKTGTYPAQIEHIWKKQTNSGKGEKLKIMFITDDRRVAYDHITINHPNEWAQSLGREKLNTLLNCIGIDYHIDNLYSNYDYGTVIDKRVNIHLSTEKGNISYTITEYSPYSGGLNE